ncbi:MAG: glycosyltransferase family 4 protein [Candidatus Omnitrophica bacterium]|nr:glycosyltransferase family 4 protein [Candidatus Omnitrophota bacterium]
MQKINILYIITKLELGGAQRQLLLLIRNLDTTKYNIFLLTSSRGILISEALSIGELKLKTIWALDRPINPLKDILAFISIYKFIKKNKIDIVHTHSSKAGILGRWAAKLAGVKFIFHTVHGWSFHPYQNWLINNLFIFLEKITSLFTDKFIVVCETDKFRGLLNRVGSEEKYVVIPYAIELNVTKDIRDDSMKKELGIKDEDLVIGTISSLKPQKAPWDFVKVAFRVKENFPRAKFLFIGDGFLRERIERMVYNYGLKRDFIFTGWRKDIGRILPIIDIFVLTSLWEGVPIAVLEAMALAKPVVVTDTGGISEIIKDKFNGFLVRCGDVEKISSIILNLLKDKMLKDMIAQNAKDSIDSKYNITSMINSTQKLYLEVIC